MARTRRQFSWRESVFAAGALLGAGAVLATLPASAAVAQNGFRQKVSHDMSRCAPGNGPAVLVTLSGIESSSGTIRVQTYRGTKQDWLQKGRWLHRVELPARAGTMKVCLPVPQQGVYGVAARHDTNGNGKTDLSKDGGGMSNNPSINIWNLGRPSYKKTAFQVGPSVTNIAIEMKYM